MEGARDDWLAGWLDSLTNWLADYLAHWLLYLLALFAHCTV